MATFTLNRMHFLCRNTHCRSFFGGFIQRAQLSTLESVRNNEQCKLEYLGGENNGTQPWLYDNVASIASICDMQCMQLYTHATLFRYLHNHYDNADVYKAWYCVLVKCIMWIYSILHTPIIIYTAISGAKSTHNSFHTFSTIPYLFNNLYMKHR